MNSLSIVVPIYNEQESIPSLLERLESVSARIMAELGVDVTVIFVNDGSKDGSLALLEGYRGNSFDTVIVDFSRNFGHSAAVTAGLKQSNSTYTAILDADLQDPPELICDMIVMVRNGYDVVYGVRKTRFGETWFKKATASLFYRILRFITEVDIPLDTGDFRLITKEVLDSLNAMPERNRFIRGLVAWSGFRQIGLEYEREARVAGTTKYSLSKMISFATDAIISFSIQPLRLSVFLGLGVIVLCFLYMLHVLYVKYIMQTTSAGWASIAILVMSLGGMNLLCTGILGIYVGRIAEEVKGRPQYLIQNIRRKDGGHQNNAD